MPRQRLRRLPVLALLASALLLSVPPLVLAQAQPLSTQASSGYQLPSAALQAIVDAPRAPSLSLSPKGDLAVQMGSPSLPSIAVVAQPELKLAGLRIHPRTFSDSRFSFGNNLSLKSIADGSERAITGLPANLAVASLGWSPDQRYVAFNHIDSTAGANELWLVDVERAQAHRLLGGLNTVLGDGYAWLPDSSGLLVRLQPVGARTAPPADPTPSGPAIQSTAGDGQVRAIRTYQDLLGSPADAAQFDYYTQVQPAIVSLGGKVQPVGQPGIYLGLSLSPDGNYLLTQKVQRPYSYVVPVSAFPRVIEVLDRNGRFVHRLASLPLVEGLPTGNDAVPTGPRMVSWRADAPATLVWAEAQDGGDPNNEAPVRDAVLTLAAPFDGQPATLAQLGSRYAGIAWGNGQVALLNERWFKTRWAKRWQIAPDNPQLAPKLLSDRSSQDRYNDPGMPLLRTADNGQRLLQFSDDGQAIFLAGAGASEAGDRPFVDRFDLASASATRVFQSTPGQYSQPLAVLDGQGQRLLVSRESPDQPANLFVIDQAAGSERQLTDIAHPVPALAGVRKEQIRYARADGVQLTAELLLPPGYDAKKDGPRPVLLWAYPGEFKSAATASQVTGSPDRFNAPSYWGPQAMLARGWVVLNNPSMPIIGEGDAEPNDTYIEQLVASAEAAVAEIERRGVGQRGKIAVGGHSYGAFMTANLLAHTRLFAAGIARSGAYNRSLTPFGFQAEERNYWQATDTYQKMSPFNYADRIKDPILFIHGEQDNNSGTFPIQSERMFAAVKGLGGNARLVMLPNESHAYRARESILHMLAETESWLEQHVGKVPAARR
ncbi:prolyl oligopeptidase family serine peptidase [Stenotrophomonas koreensis]|uniref:alpha/beta hydrolase family protein n=1 Tax=Stenotrophomonas koreensis TaxID=266128 RepID=UPI00339894C8